MTDRQEVLRVENLTVRIIDGRKEVVVLHDVSFTVKSGERWGIAGESGAGKSMTMNAIASLLPRGMVRMSGKILYRLDDGSWFDLMEVPHRERHRFVSERVAVIFQDSIHALNPHERILKQWGDTVALHHPELCEEERTTHVLAQMEVFGIRGGLETLHCYPSQLSGGMKQRIAIAMALESQVRIGSDGENGCSGIIIADEPTTSLDSVTQRNVVNYIRDVCDAGGKTLLYVSHNLGILQYLCDKLMVFKDGSIVEQGEADELLFRAKHPYTKQIIRETMAVMGAEVTA